MDQEKMATEEKPIHTVILDSGPIIRGDPSASTLLQKCSQILTTPAVINEIRDESARQRLQTLLLPFLTLRSPNPESLRIVSEFAKRTGDRGVLSQTDLGILALAYEVECERNGGDWRLRRVPGQQGLNGSPPAKEDAKGSEEANEQTSALPTTEEHVKPEVSTAKAEPSAAESEVQSTQVDVTTDAESQTPQSTVVAPEATPATTPLSWADRLRSQPSSTASPVNLLSQPAPTSSTPSTASAPTSQPPPQSQPPPSILSQTDDAVSIARALEATHLAPESSEDHITDEDSDSEGWITPSNIKSHQAKEEAATHGNTSNKSSKPPAVMQVATITQDFAMQNVCLQMNLNLLSPKLQRIRHVKTFILRCQACFNVVRNDLSKQFCPRCGKPTLSKVSCSTDAATGKVSLHLAKNYQVNKRGDRFSMPKAAITSSNGKVISGGGQGGWAAGMILSEDQKEYERAATEKRRAERRVKDVMDEDFLPGLMGGNVSGGGGGFGFGGPGGAGGGRIKVGAGRNVNAKKRK